MLPFFYPNKKPFCTHHFGGYDIRAETFAKHDGTSRPKKPASGASAVLKIDIAEITLRKNFSEYIFSRFENFLLTFIALCDIIHSQ